MASSSSSPFALTSSSTLLDSKLHRQSAAPPPQCVPLPTLSPPPLQSQLRPRNTGTYGRKLGRNVTAMATGEAPAEVGAVELPDIVKKAQEAWEKVEDKYAVSSLAAAGAIAAWASIGVVSAIDRLPLVPGALELVGIGYTGWFVYKNMIFKPDREALIKKIKDTYTEIIGSS